MGLPDDVRDILRCPKCHAEIEYVSAIPAFNCHACHVQFPVVEGLPCFLISEAIPLVERADAADPDQT